MKYLAIYLGLFYFTLTYFSALKARVFNKEIYIINEKITVNSLIFESLLWKFIRIHQV